MNALPKHELSQNDVPLNAERFIDTQKRYNRQIDALQQQIVGNPAHEEMSRKLHYYKNYPHLNDQEVETYLSIEDKMKTQQQGHTQALSKQQSREIEA